MQLVPRNDTGNVYLCIQIPNVMDKHASRIEIFNSTLALLQQGWYTAQDGSAVSLPSTEEVMAAATMYSQASQFDN